MIRNLLPYLLLLISFNLSAQTTYGLNFNLLTVQGEVGQESLISDDIGLGLGFNADVPLINPRYEFSWRLDYRSLRMDYIGNRTTTNVSFAEIKATQWSAQGGLNIYLLSNHNMANIYQPFRPYAFVYGGLVYQNNQVEKSDNLPFPSVEGGFVAPYAELGIGLKIRINPTWAFNTQLSFGSSFDDELDGLIGTTDVPDITGSLRIGLVRRFR